MYSTFESARNEHSSIRVLAHPISRKATVAVSTLYDPETGDTMNKFIMYYRG